MITTHSRGEVAARSLRYPKAPKKENDRSKPRVLRSTGVNCSVEGAERTFAAIRRTFGSRGAQTYNTIVAWSKAELNPDDPADQDRALDLAVAIAEEGLPPGTPSTVTVQADGRTGCLHAHIISCATIVQDCELDGTVWRAGRKLAGQWTEAGAFADRANGIVERRGFVNYLAGERRKDMRLTKHEVATKRKQDDYDERAANGALQPGEQRPVDSWRVELMKLIARALEDHRSKTWDGLREILEEAGATFTHRVLKSGQTRVTWFPPGRKTGVRGSSLDDALRAMESDPAYEDLTGKEQREAKSATKTQWYMAEGTGALGDFFTYESVSEMLQQNALGQPRRQLKLPQVEERPDKVMAAPTDEQVEQARAAMARMAAAARAARDLDDLDAWLDERMADGTLDAIEDRLRDRYGDDAWADISDWARAAMEARAAAMFSPGAEPATGWPKGVDALGGNQRDRLLRARREWVDDDRLREELLAAAADRNAPSVTATYAPAPVAEPISAPAPTVEQDDFQHEEPSSASAPSGPVGASASAPTPTEAYRSGLRELKPRSEAGRLKLDRMVAYDERMHSELADGGSVLESEVPAGFSPDFLSKHGKRMDAALAGILSQRADKRAARSQSFEAAKELSQQLDAKGTVVVEVRAKREQDDLRLKLRVENQLTKRLATEIAASDYSPVDVDAERSRLMQEARQRQMMAQVAEWEAQAGHAGPSLGD